MPRDERDHMERAAGEEPRVRLSPGQAERRRRIRTRYREIIRRIAPERADGQQREGA